MIMDRVNTWLTGPYDESSKNEIRFLLENDKQALVDAFYTDLTFGTGGLRALMGVGTNRLNAYTIQIATQGLANYLLAQKKCPLSVLVGFDSRHNSQEFALETARVLAGNGIRVYLLSELRPTPFISFACREKKCDAAVMITASHNPKEYNGYKVYWSDGAQVVPPHDTGIIKEVEKLTSIAQVKRSGSKDPLIETSDFSLDEAYLRAIRPLQHFPEQNKNEGSTLQITYTSFHGTGITMVPKALRDWGFTSIHIVDEQCIPDGNFPTLKFPNPEYKETLQLGMEKLISTHSDILFATDPDADRMGVVVMHKSAPVILTGNETAAICVEYLCDVMKEQDTLPKNGAFVTTIVTTELLKTIAEDHNQTCIEVLTGFKYIGEKIHLWETMQNSPKFIYGAEESYGFLLGTHARDKDAIIASCLLAEIALHAKKQNKTLIDLLHQIYNRYGFYREAQLSIPFHPGKAGMDAMQALMTRLRAHLPHEIASKSVIYVEDYLTKTRTYLKTGKQEPLDLPISDVLLFRLDDKSKVIIRPSGTEPKVKVYLSTFVSQAPSIAEGLKLCDTKIEHLTQTLKNELS
ncbi:MAG: phospho-sugar mutase [Rhabdochlamydiaceae bacterium]|nr:phospho-sugar mutase [Rhabdochlamydiaceae bacterium]